MTKLGQDLMLGFVVSGVALGYVYSAGRIPTSLLSDAVGPGGFPTALGSAVALLGMLLALRSALAMLRARRPAPADGEATPFRLQAKSFGLLLIGLGYILAAPAIGYFPALFLVVAAVAWLAGAKPGWRFALNAFSIAALLTVVFVTLMHTTQPEGVLHAYLPRIGF